MRRSAYTLAALAALAMWCTSASAQQPVGESRRVLCAMTEASECSTRRTCFTGFPDMVNIPTFVTIDLDDKLLTASGDGVDELESPILSMTAEGEVLVLQGVENGRGWSATIDKSSGQMSVGIAGTGVGFVVFGSCAPLDG